MEGQVGGSARMPSISVSLKVQVPRSGVNMASGSVRTPAVVGGSGSTSSMLNRPYCVAKVEVCRLCQSFAVESTPEGREPTTRLSRSEFSDSTVLPQLLLNQSSSCIRRSRLTGLLSFHNRNHSRINSLLLHTSVRWKSRPQSVSAMDVSKRCRLSHRPSRCKLVRSTMDLSPESSPRKHQGGCSWNCNELQSNSPLA
eukprot:6205256-Amphidinium_carterae.2